MIGIQVEDIQLLQCPTCSRQLNWNGSEVDGLMINGVLECDRKHIWRVNSGIPNLADRRQLTSKDRLLDVIYDFLAPVHDYSEAYLLPVLQYPDHGMLRPNYIEAMMLDGDDMHSNSASKKVLEVGVGTGANIPLINEAIRKNQQIETWAVDLNSNMLENCARKNREEKESILRLALADAHSLPFADSTFDRVLHVGGINIYRDIKQGLEEMARVAKPGTPIVVVDEGLDQESENNVFHHLAFKWLTCLDEIIDPPADLLPDNCKLISVHNVSRFYYCLVFEKGA